MIRVLHLVDVKKRLSQNGPSSAGLLALALSGRILLFAVRVMLIALEYVEL